MQAVARRTKTGRPALCTVLAAHPCIALRISCLHGGETGRMQSSVRQLWGIKGIRRMQVRCTSTELANQNVYWHGNSLEGV